MTQNTTSRSDQAPIAPRRARLGHARLRLLHWLLTPGLIRQTSAARLRGWARVIVWMRSDRAQRVDLLKRAATLPLRAWRESGAAVADFGGDVHAASGVPPSTQHRHLWWLAVRHGLEPVTYVEYRLYQPERRRRAAHLVQETEHTRVVRWVHRQDGDPDRATFRDKSAFAAWCRQHDLPHVPSVLEVEDGVVAWSATGDGRAEVLPARDLFSKPNDGTAGHGVERWRFVGDDGRRAWADSRGRQHSPDELVAELMRLSSSLELREGRRSRRLLLQLCLQNHPEMAALAPDALCTARVLVHRPPGGRARVARATLRLAVGGAIADNYAVGGIVAPIDIATGTLQRASRREGRILSYVERHPDTAGVIQGARLPCWAETIELAERGLELAPRMPVVGWDVAFTRDGPVLVEGNMAPNPGLVQKASGLPLGHTQVPATLDAHVRRALGL